MFQRVTDLKKLNPNLKVLLAIGGFCFFFAELVYFFRCDKNNIRVICLSQ